MRHIIILSFLLLLMPLSSLRAKDYYVKPKDAPGLNGSSWGWASNDLQGTIDKAVAGDVIYVSVGTYYGGFTMKEGVTVMGGYTANTSDPKERIDIMSHTTPDPAKHSILDGENRQRVLTQYTDFNTKTIWNGFVIQNGNPSPDFRVGSIIYSKNQQGKIIGVIYQYDDETERGMMMATEEQKKQWGGYGQTIDGLTHTNNRDEAAADTDGLANMNAIIDYLGEENIDFSDPEYALNGNYAARWCSALEYGGYSDWYMPSAGEMQEVSDSGVASVFRNVGAPLSGGYWTSTQIEDNMAWSYHFGASYLHPLLKYVSSKTRPIHAFEGNSSPDGIYSAGGGAFLNRNGILENCIVTGNYSSSYGGGVYAGYGSDLVDCLVEGNDAPDYPQVYWAPVKLEEVASKSSVQVYPNPVKMGNPVYIKGDNAFQQAAYVIYDLSGKQLGSGSISLGEYALQAPDAKGIYILSIATEKETINHKIIVY